MKTNELYSLEYWKHKCKVFELESKWLDELCNYERENQYQLNGDMRDENFMREWKEEIDQLELNFRKEKYKFNKTYNI